MNPDPSVPVLAQEAGAAVTGAEQVAEPRPQIVGGLNDTVFGLAITLLATALNIGPSSPTSQIIQQLGGFAYSFTLIAWVWLGRYRLVRTMRTETVGFLRLNFLLLFLIISYTYVLRLFALSTSTPARSRSPRLIDEGTAILLLFALLTALVMATLAAQHHYALARELVAPAQYLGVSRARNALLLTSAIFAISLPFILVRYTLIASMLWVCTIPAGIIYRQRNRLRDRHAPRAAEQSTGASHASN